MAKQRPPVDEGKRAPAFRLSDADGETLASKSLAGSPYVLFFYPKASTPGCTTETCAFQEAYPAFDEMEVAVLGVSPDDPARQARFRDKYGVTFPLLCDTEHVLAESYGCWKEKKLYGRTSMGIERSTFLVDGDGIVRRVWRKVKVAGHVEEVEAAVAELV